MPIDADKVRELAARGEGTTLDFKRDDYDWNGRGNPELAKDLMAIANVLREGAEPGYILIGVDDAGGVVGIPRAAHLDDAKLHEKVRYLLNHPPAFLYYEVDVGLDARSVGVYEIEPGGRPFFATKNAPPLQHPLALYRDGTNTHVASPPQIVAWHREDDIEGLRNRRMELEEREAERQVYASARTVDGTTGAGHPDTKVVLEVFNHSRRLITLRWLRWRFEWTTQMLEVIAERVLSAHPGMAIPPAEDRRYWIAGEMPPGYSPPQGGGNLSASGGAATILPGQGIGHGARIPVQWSQDETSEHFGAYGLEFDYLLAEWFKIHFEIDVVGELGAETTLRVSWP